MSHRIRIRADRRGGFSLIELLVVISVIALLISILLPSLSRARDRVKAVVCASNLSQLGLAIVSYANDNRGLIPRGPKCGGPYDFACAEVASNQLWIGSADPSHANRPNGMGSLIKDYGNSKETYFCPADDSSDPEEELPRIGTERDAFGSYTYRQLDYLPESRRKGSISDLGVNVLDERRVRVEALAFDRNSLGPEAMNLHHTNHRGLMANVLYRDRSVKKFSNTHGTFSIPAEAFLSPMDILIRLDQILLNADFGYAASPDAAPEIPTEP